MNERIKNLRKTLGLNQTDFGEKIGVKQTTVAGYETGIREPMDSVILSMCREFKVNEKWLRFGEGEMFRKPSDEVGYYVEDLLEYDGNGNSFYDMIIEMMKTYCELDEKSQAVILDFFKNVSEGIGKKKKED